MRGGRKEAAAERAIAMDFALQFIVAVRYKKRQKAY